jgi:poly(A) polymerase
MQQPTPSGDRDESPVIGDGTSSPSNKELKLTTELHECLQRRGLFEDNEGTQKRAAVIYILSEVVNKWMQTLAMQRVRTWDLRKVYIGLRVVHTCIQNLGKSVCEGKAQLRVFGSCRLNVHSPDADIDVLCICPRHVTRIDFFSSFCACLRERKDVSMLFPVPEAYTPVREARALRTCCLLIVLWAAHVHICGVGYR